MSTRLKLKQLIDTPVHLIHVIILTINLLLFTYFLSKLPIKSLSSQLLKFSTIKTDQSIDHSLSIENHISSFNWKLINHNTTLETTIQCVGSLYNQSCLYTNLYYVDNTFTILTVEGRNLTNFSVRIDAFAIWDTAPTTRVFNSYSDLEKFVRTIIDPKLIPSVTVHFGQPWHHNIAHALFDGLYPAYVALIRFSPRHLHPFRILAAIDNDRCNECWSEDVYSRFAGLGILKQTVLNEISKGKWFMFDELIMGSGTLCQRCTQPNLQLPGGVELGASRLFRDRMYQQHGFIPSIVRKKSSSEHRTSQDIVLACIVDNKRFTSEDKKEMNDAIEEINSYTKSYLNKTINNQTKLEWPLINVTYIYYSHIRAEKLNTTGINATLIDSRSPTYELINNDFMAQLKLVRQMDIHLSGPGTGQFYQTFLSDGSININLGGIRPPGFEKTEQAYTSYFEQHLTSGAPYIKGLYYPINERPKGIKKDQVIQLIRHAAKMILDGFDLPVNPQENLAVDGKLFVEMCQKDEEFCSLVTKRLPNKEFSCLDFWSEDFIHEYGPWKLGGFIHGGRNISCPFNRTLLQQLRNKYGIKHYSNQ